MSESKDPSNSSGKVVVPGGRKHGVKAETGAKAREGPFGRMRAHSITEDYIDRVMGCLEHGPDLLEKWKKEHRKEGTHRG